MKNIIDRLLIINGLLSILGLKLEFVELKAMNKTVFLFLAHCYFLVQL